MSLTLEEHLLKLGYPPDSLVSEFQLDGQHLADMVVIHPETKAPLALYEHKDGLQLQPEALKAQLKMYQSYFDTPVPAYVVQTHGQKLKIFQVSDFSATELPRLPKFDELTTGQALRQLRTRHHTVDTFSGLCWGLALLVSVLFAGDLAGWLTITAERLGVMAIIIGLTIVPFVNKLKVYWFEYEKRT